MTYLLDPDQFEPGTKEWIDAINAKTRGRDYHGENAAAASEVEVLRADLDAARDNAEMMNDAASRYLRRAEQAEKERDALRAAVKSLQERNLLFMRERNEARAEQRLKDLKMDWIENGRPDCGYTNVSAETPLGQFLITWKGWKDYPTYVVDEPKWLAGECFGDLESAKTACEDELERRCKLVLALGSEGSENEMDERGRGCRPCGI